MPPQLAIAAHLAAAHYRWQTLRGPRLAAYQAERAERIAAYAQTHSPFYREHWQGQSPAAWSTLPTVDKQLMMRHFSRFNTQGVTLETALEVALKAETSRDFRPVLPGPDSLTVGLSSGTSGHRGLFLVSPEEQAAWAGVILARTLHVFPWHTVARGGLRVAFFLRSNSNLYQQTRSALVRFHYFDLMQPLEVSVAALNRFQPEVLIGPPLLLGLLAQELLAGRLVIRPNRLISVAEVLEPQEARHLETLFQVRVEQIYQCTEGLLAVTCAAGSLHLQEDLVVFQFESLTGGDWQPGQPCQPILTDLWRTTQPIIRYRLNDILVLDPHLCRCGSSFQVVQRIEGRSDDICYFPTDAEPDAKLRPVFPDAVRRMVLLAHPSIADYRVIQNTPGTLTIHLELQAETDRPPTAVFAEVAAAVRSQVTLSLQGYGCRLYPAANSLTIVEGIPPLPAGRKRRRVQAQPLADASTA